MGKNKDILYGQLIAARAAAANAYEHPVIRSCLEKYGYDEKRLKEGAAMTALSEKLFHKQQRKYGEMWESLEKFNNAWKKANKRYMVHVKVARVALQGDKPSLLKLHLVGDRKNSFSGWLTQAGQFYNGALSEPVIREKLEAFGITKEQLQDGLALVEKANAAYVTKELKKGEAQAATRERNLAFKKMNKWTANLIAIARVALVEANKSQLLEALDVNVPS